jgi:hypothetical protein
LADAVNLFIDLGEQAAVEELNRLSDDDWSQHQLGPGGAWYVNERIGWVCRVLFEAKDSKPLRPPMFGGHLLPFNTMPDANWPLYPVAQSGAAFFVLSEGYMLAGYPESPRAYIEYCRQHGVFRKNRLSVPSKKQAQNDALALRRSAVWQAIKWTDGGQGFSYSFDEPSAWKFIQRQADDIR